MFAFATLCVYFAYFAVQRFYRKGREERAKKRKGMRFNRPSCTTRYRKDY
jgi:hypothetical protein